LVKVVQSMDHHQVKTNLFSQWYSWQVGNFA